MKKTLLIVLAAVLTVFALGIKISFNNEYNDNPSIILDFDSQSGELSVENKGKVYFGRVHGIRWAELSLPQRQMAMEWVSKARRGHFGLSR